MEYGTLGIRGMIFGQDHLFLGIGAANGGAIAVAAGDDLPGADALYPCDFMGGLLVGGAQQLTFVRPGGA